MRPFQLIIAILALLLSSPQAEATSPKACLIQQLERVRQPGDAADFSNQQRPQLGAIPTVADNAQFIRLSQTAPPQPSLRFIEVENAVLKSLNDQVFRSKDLVDRTENLWREILLTELSKSPLLSQQILGQYQDFKSLRFAFPPNPEIDRQFSIAYERAMKRFSEQLGQTPLAKSYAGLPGSLGDPTRWHMAAAGNTVDEAGLTARYARGLPATTGPPLQTIEDAAPWIQKQAIAAEEIRVNWTSSLNDEQKRSLLRAVDSTGSPQFIPHEGVFELIRKVDFSKGELAYLDLGKKIQKRFGSELTPKQLRELHRYAASVDAFSVGILIPERVVNDLSPAQYGIVSADFAGQGGRNLAETAASLTRSRDKARQGQITEVIAQARAAEVKATQRMRLLNDEYKAALDRTIGKDSVKRLTFSGDDGIYLPEKEWTEDDRLQLVSHLTEISETPSQFRLTWVPTQYPDRSVIPVESRSRLINQAETIEKNLRSALEGKVSREELTQAVFLIEFWPASPNTIESGTYSLILSSKGETSLELKAKSSEELQRLLQEVQAKAPSSKVQWGGLRSP